MWSLKPCQLRTTATACLRNCHNYVTPTSNPHQNGFLERDTELPVHEHRPQTQDPQPSEQHSWDEAEQEIGVIDTQRTNVQRPHDVIMST